MGRRLRTAMVVGTLGGLFVGINLAAAATPDPAPVASVPGGSRSQPSVGADAVRPPDAPVRIPPATVAPTPPPAPTTTAPPPVVVPAPTPDPLDVPALPGAASPTVTPTTTPEPVTAPPLSVAASVAGPVGIGCTAEPFASAFARTGLTPADVAIGGCEIVDDIPGARPEDRVCGQVSGPPVARTIHLARRAVEGGCRREPVGVTVHEIGHAWHLADATRTWRVIDALGLPRDDEASFEVVAECFVEAVGYLDTACTPSGAAIVRAELDAGRAR